MPYYNSPMVYPAMYGQPGGYGQAPYNPGGTMQQTAQRYEIIHVNGEPGARALQGYKDTIALPCMSAQATVAANDVVTLHTETTVYIPVCCNGTPTINAVVGGVAGTVNHVCASIVKLA